MDYRRIHHQHWSRSDARLPDTGSDGPAIPRRHHQESARLLPVRLTHFCSSFSTDLSIAGYGSSCIRYIFLPTLSHIC